MADPKVGDKLINEHGTCVEIVNAISGQELQVNEIAADRVTEFLEAGYWKVTDDDVIPLQAHQVNAE